MLLALVIKKEKPDYGQLIILAGATIIMGFAVERIIYVIDFVQEIIGITGLNKGYLGIIFKMLGITYCADFSANLCRDAGHSAIAGQIEIFAKLSILILSIPGLKYVLDILNEFL